MALQLKCCVGGCDSTNHNEKLFCMPVKDSLRNLWMSFLIPTNPALLGLKKSQLLNYRVCARHFDRTQFDEAGSRIRYSYPCLFTASEIAHGVPLNNEDYKVENEHNYCSSNEQEPEVNAQDVVMVTGMQADTSLVDHQYIKSNQEACSIFQCEELTSSHPSTSLSGCDILAVPEGSKNTPNSNFAQIKTGKPVKKQSNSKSRKFMKKCTDIINRSLGTSGLNRLQKAQNIAENCNIMEGFSSLTKKCQAFLLMQMRLLRKKKTERRFSLDEKLFALTLLKQCKQNGYKFLQTMFALPAKRTLNRLSQKIHFECGLNKNIFNHIKHITKSWDTKKKLCSLVFDEVALTPRLIYNENKEKINGFVDIAGERKQKLADHALVFMVRGICSSWRQSIAYYFCEGTVSSAELQKILKQIVPQLHEAGLIPLAMVCDQGSTFRSCFKTLKQDTICRQQSIKGKNSDNTVHIAGYNLYLFHDPPHLLKGIRNNFLDKDMLFKGKRASWKDILYIYDLDNKSGHTRALPKLTAEHVDAQKIKKMKVKTAAQVLSARTAAMLNYTHAVHKHLDSSSKHDTMKITAEAVEFFDDLFDSVNGSSGGTKGKLRCAVKPNSVHQESWRTSIQVLRNIEFIDAKSKHVIKSGAPRNVRVPSLDGWIVTLESFLGLSELLFKKYGVDYFYPRYINQDPLENFFGRIRAINYRNVNPDVNTFGYAFKSLIMSNILSPHSEFANCEEDNGDSIIDIRHLFSEETNIGVDKENIAPNIISVVPSPLSSKTLNVSNVIAEKVRVQISAYTAGYICRKTTKKVNCSKCTKTYTTNESQGIHEYIQYREYKRLKNSNLAYPKAQLLLLYREISQMVHNYLNESCHHLEIKKKLINVIKKQRNISWLGCKEHKRIVQKYIITLILRLQCHNWCKIINNILEGKIDEKYVVGPIQLKALQKYKKIRLRKSKINK